MDSHADIHATALIEPGAEIGPGCVIHAHAVITRHCRLARGVTVHAYSVLGGDPQYLKFDTTTATGVCIGPGTVIREHCTVNRSIYAGQDTVIGERCFLMANAHVGHDCLVEDDVVLALPSAGQATLGMPGLVGHCVNVLPVRLYVDAQESVDQLPADAEVLGWLQEFVDQHYQPEPRRRRRPQSFQALTDRFGNPASVSTGKHKGGS